MTNPKEALEWYERKRVEARAMADRDCKSCKHNKPDGCSRWNCEYEPVMSDLISRVDAIEAIASRDETDGTVKVFTGREVNEIISALPSADRPTGEWVRKYDKQINCYWYECNQCGEYRPRNVFGKEWSSPYCPNCGAKMVREDGEKE